MKFWAVLKGIGTLLALKEKIKAAGGFKAWLKSLWKKPDAIDAVVEKVRKTDGQG